MNLLQRTNKFTALLSFFACLLAADLAAGVHFQDYSVDSKIDKSYEDSWESPSAKSRRSREVVDETSDEDDLSEESSQDERRAVGRPERDIENSSEYSSESYTSGGGVLGSLIGMIVRAIESFFPSITQPLFLNSRLYETYQRNSGNGPENLTNEEREEYQNTLLDLETPDDVVGFFRGEYDEGPAVEYNNAYTNRVFGDPAGLFVDRDGNCHSFARFAQEALENMPGDVEAYETRLIHNTYDEGDATHVMLAYRNPATGKWGFMDPYDNYSPEMIEEAGIDPANPEAIVEFISLSYASDPSKTRSALSFKIPGPGNPERITFIDRENFQVFSQAYIINEDGTFEEEKLLQRFLSYFFS